MTRMVLQKLLHPGMAKLVLESGYDQVGGFVTDASAAAALRTPSQVNAAYGYADENAPWVDVARFSVPPCAKLSQPAPTERPWPTYPQGFLRPVDQSIVPVWRLSTTRYSPGAEVWRIHRDGRQELMSTYGGAARGWSGAREWRPASRYFGTRALWNDIEYAADVTGDAVELTSFTEPDGDGWTQQRPATWSRTVALADCEVYELHFTASLHAVPVRVLEVISADVRVQLVEDDPAVANQLNANMIDIGVFELSGVPGSLLTETQLVANQLAIS
jgi:hypothetical protein